MDSDERLYERVQRGDLLAFDELYACYGSPSFGFLVSCLRNRADAEDALHEVFLGALKGRGVTFEGGGFRAWLYRIARNATLNRRRSDAGGASTSTSTSTSTSGGRYPSPHGARNDPVRMVVLVDGETSSGGEIVAAAPRHGRHADVAGTKTLGKWSLQTVEEFPNGYAIEYTISLIRGADGETYDGVGLSPDVEVDLERKATAAALREQNPTKRLAIDPPLRTAPALARLKG